MTLLGATGYATLSEQSARLESLRKAIELKPNDLKLESEYLNDFPSSYKSFTDVFYGQGDQFDELYSVYLQHMQLLDRLDKKFPKKVKAIWYGVAEGGPWDADALGELQQQLAQFGANNTREFAEDLANKPAKDRLKIIDFLNGGVENYDAYPEYATILKNFHSLGFSELYRQFKTAKEKRISNDKG